METVSVLLWKGWNSSEEGYMMACLLPGVVVSFLLDQLSNLSIDSFFRFLLAWNKRQQSEPLMCQYQTKGFILLYRINGFWQNWNQSLPEYFSISSKER
jgi:hypothetical protein